MSTMLDLRRMMLLCDLADLGTVAAVAERRNITGSAVSQQLRVLEAEAGAILFRRVGRTLGLTRSGEVLVEHGRRVLAAMDEAMSALAATRDRTSGHLTISAFNRGIPMLAAPMMLRLGREEPDLHIQVQQATSVASLRMLRQGELDLAITCRYDSGAQEPLNGLAGERLLWEPLVLLAPSRLRRRIRKLGLAALADEPWVTGPQDSGLGLAVLHAGDTAGFIPQITHRVLGAQNICDLAATELATAIVPRMSVPDELQGLVIDDFDLGGRVISAVVREGRQRDPNIGLLLAALRALVRENWPAEGVSYERQLPVFGSGSCGTRAFRASSF